MAELKTRGADHWLFLGLLLLIAWLPIPLGSIRPLGYGIMQIISFSLLSGWLLFQLFTCSAFPPIGKSAKVALLLFVASLAYHLLLVIPLSLEAIRTLSPAAYQIYSFTLNETAKETFSVSLGVGLTLQEFLKSAAYVSIFFLVLVLVNSRKRLLQLAFTLILVGFAEALFGMFDAYLGGVLFRIPVTGVGGSTYPVTGTYVNYAHFGGLLEMSIPLAVGMIIAQSRPPETSSDWRKRLIALAHWLLSKHVWIFLFLLAMVTALFFSTSRGATISLIAASGLTLSATIALKGSNKRRSNMLLILAIPVVAGLLLGADQLISRLEKSGLETDRHLHRETAYRVIADYPVFGVGPGNWTRIYMAYQDPGQYFDKILNHVHNDYLELLAEQGVIGFVLFGTAVLIALGTMAEALRRRRDPLMRGVLIGCVTAIISLLIHSLVDFNLQESANAAWFSVILAMGLIASRMPHDA